MNIPDELKKLVIKKLAEDKKKVKQHLKELKRKK